MNFKLIAAIAGCLTLAAGAVSAATFTERTAFEATLATSVTDDYSNPAYQFIQSDAVMSAVLGETDYKSTGFTDWNIVQSGGSYCAGCNGSFLLSFGTTSVGTLSGVFGVGFDFGNSSLTPYHAFVTYGDGSSQDFALPSGSFASSSLPSFFGINSNLLISSIALGLANGGTTRNGSFVLDNLTIGSVAPIPVPAALPLMLGALGAISFARKRRARAQA